MADENGPATLTRAGRELGQQPRLADTSVSGDDRDRTVGVSEAVQKRIHFGASADQGTGGEHALIIAHPEGGVYAVTCRCVGVWVWLSTK
ncbi:hypothetical protein GCM10007304_12940 [Rhodococcoides trifolii]|uniref:Uncharacterized protein n=1 Tax=Rhodococcoides trifolii TaxID=908250 RepID=A0A917CXI6_9NOCA|nr:hypothetical protein GCM10007304_12940 [Rhodococcus trifolii]